MKWVNVGRSMREGCRYRILILFLPIVDAKASINVGAYRRRITTVVIKPDLLAVKAIISSLTVKVNPQAKKQAYKAYSRD